MAFKRTGKDILHLQKTIASFSDGQATTHDLAFESGEAEMIVRIIPNDGLYKGGTFDFRLELKGYPSTAPSVTCLTKIYHPNIDFYSSDDNICLNLIDSEWTSTCTLEDVVQGILFLLFNPNLDDALSLWFGATTDYEEFAENVARSLRGETVEDEDFVENRSNVSTAESDLSSEKIADVIMGDNLSSVVNITLGDKSCDVTQMNVLNLESTAKAETTLTREVTRNLNGVSGDKTLIQTQVMETTELHALNYATDGKTTTSGDTSQFNIPNEQGFNSLYLIVDDLEPCKKNSLYTSRRQFTIFYCDNLAPEINLMSALLPNMVKYLFRSVNLRSKKSNHFL